ncbi:MAG TPA: ABC transporter ATP-binding protein [Streptosporangiaceae bacterium]|jgi:ATP-binding cassette subfamily B protein|nr:ABC transporter ATP-binding protein [Streptosporangiaceae bacterium]
MSSAEADAVTAGQPADAAMRSIDELPPALASMWRLCKLGFHYEPALMGVAFGLTLLAALPDALLALWFKLLGEGLLDHRPGLLAVSAAGLGVSAVATWFLQTVSTRLQRRFRDKVTIALESHVARLQASISTIAHQERPDYLDRLSVLREQIFTLDHMYMSVFATAGWILRLAVTVVLLATVNPVLILLVIFALPTVAVTSWRPAVERNAQERGGQADRLARHLFTLNTTAASGKELRVLGTAPHLADRRRRSWEQWYGPVAAARTGSSIWYAAGWAVFAAAYVGAIVLVAAGPHASAASAILVLAAGSRLSSYVGATVGEIGFLRGIWMDGARRLAWLEDYAAAAAKDADQPAPLRITDGIRFERVSFRYPGASTPALVDVDLYLPAGSVVAVVGENGAGKSTLVKLLAKLYAPNAGRILIDDADLARIEPEQWRRRLAGAFQDFFRFELKAGQAVGLGDLPRIDDEQAVMSAVEAAGAGQLIEALPNGLASQLGPTWPEGVDVSFGQWQKLALARGFMRDEPLIVALDEPTAALDAETEHELFEQYARRARQRGDDGRITILVSHRFSTVRMADLIVVLAGARVAEVGSHDDLMARGGPYSELYQIQAKAYQ